MERIRRGLEMPSLAQLLPLKKGWQQANGPEREGLERTGPERNGQDWNGEDWDVQEDR